MRFTPGCCCEYQCGMAFGLQPIGPTTDMDDYFSELSSQKGDPRDRVWQELIKVIYRGRNYNSSLEKVQRNAFYRSSDGSVPSGTGGLITSPGNDTYICGKNQNCTLGGEFTITDYYALARPWTNWHLSHYGSYEESRMERHYVGSSYYEERHNFTISYFDIEPDWEAVDPRNLIWYRFNSSSWVRDDPDFDALACLFGYGHYGFRMRTPIYNSRGEIVNYSNDAKTPYFDKIQTKLEEQGALEGNDNQNFYKGCNFGFVDFAPFNNSAISMGLNENTYLESWQPSFGETMTNEVPETIDTSLIRGIYYLPERNSGSPYKYKFRLWTETYSDHADDIKDALDGSDIDMSDLYAIDISDPERHRYDSALADLDTIGLQFHYATVEIR